MRDQLQTIVVPVDFGAASANAIALAGDLARACEAGLHVMHAESLDAPPYFTASQVEALERERQLARAQAHDYLRDFAQQRTSSTFTTAIVERPVVEAVAAAAPQTDLIVMGTHGRRGVSRWWLGSVAERVLRDTAVPVLVVHEHSGDLPRENPLLLIATDDPAGQGPELAWGQRLATCLHGRWATVSTDEARAQAEALGAAVVVVRSPWPHGSSAAVHQAQHLLQGCRRPTLFVPTPQ